MTNDTLALLLPDEPRAPESAEEVYAVLAERIARYTMGDSTSVPIETAQRLLESLLYCVDLQRRVLATDSTEHMSLAQRRETGVLEAKRIAKRAKLLLRQLQHTPPPLTNTAYCDTLEALPAFFAGYDADFFAREIPCSFDYPLCQPVSETLYGAEYMADYLRRLLTETAFLRAFSAEALRSLYLRYYIDYADLLVNLYLPAAEMATLCVLAEQPVHALWVPPAKLAQIERSLALASEQEALQRVKRATEQAIRALSVRGDYLLHYTEKTALDLLVRIRAQKSPE
jgi:hypothetical protein